MKKLILPALTAVVAFSFAFTVAHVSAPAMYKVNTASSIVTWEGTKPTGVHHGTINLSGGQLMTDAQGHISGGSFDLDMNSIADKDMDGRGKEGLEKHLKTGDFFETEKFPTGKFVITKVVSTPSAKEGNHQVTGNLTIRDKTNEVSFPATIHMANGKIMATTPKFYIDRTQWGITFHSGMIGTLQDKLVHDAIGLSIKLEASK